ncbi:cytochrome P450/oxidoreductase [Marinobacter sp. 71-i]|uniref:Cytochrome P450/oxidoreductase n=1 Tax=Marinobacter iranensis TaxID=2962607 RepID=A0ABT5Y8Y6_9GAMM|nr:cytochrome P450/oxidoreductase [Marinobacter iranensis]MDF0750034.1 cytochrome P450/oxidoreductase [Marinobacter iranensis]
MTSQSADKQKAHRSMGCPVTAAAAGGCPLSHQAAEFDPFGSDYQLDPAEALRWSRAQEPVFYSPKLDYWVISRYDDIKAVFRDNITFSPSIALEKITPVSQEAQDVLLGYDYAMNRTLVNEDEPQHTERRRVLMEHFAPENLERHKPMIRRLTRDALDRIIDQGEADLVDEMLWEIPLTVALHFLGVPEEDMGKLREYSIAHTVNTWGRPSKEEQIEVAHAVGNFWQYAGKVLEKMRATPDGPGWMRYAIRQQANYPEVVTDSYLHSMMMAIIVAAHETTAHASANMFRRLLERRELWEELCRKPQLIPNAAEECLRHTGSVVAWRRITTRPVTIGDVELPKGARLLMVTASGNHDERHFENPDELDLYRDNTVDHLTFGYGSHQCMGKNIARMEMRIFLEEFTRRLPHMELVPDQQFTYLPNTSFRGPDHLRVRWDPSCNPERLSEQAREPRMDFEIGAPAVKDLARSVRVADKRLLAEGIVGLSLEDLHGRPLPNWTPGAHVELLLDDMGRHYSLCGDPDRPERLELAVLREPESRGGSVYVHERLQVGDEIGIRGPKNHFRLDERAEEYVLIAGGIGITPIIAMADRLKRLGKPYTLHYAGRSRRTMAFLDRLVAAHGDRLYLYPGDEGERLRINAVIGELAAGRQIYACGPERLLEALELATNDWPAGVLHIEHFGAAGTLLDPGKEEAFEVLLEDSGFTVRVASDQTLLEALRAAGIDVASDCEEGLCGTCEVAVTSGEDIDHRDRVLSREERNEGKRMMACCSRARARISLAL